MIFTFQTHTTKEKRRSVFPASLENSDHWQHRAPPQRSQPAGPETPAPPSAQSSPSASLRTPSSPTGMWLCNPALEQSPRATGLSVQYEQLESDHRRVLPIKKKKKIPQGKNG